MRSLLLLITFAFAVFSSHAEARSFHSRHYEHHHTRRISHLRLVRKAHYSYHRRIVSYRRYIVYGRGNEGTILPHPAGCPRIAFCGCGAALEIFGRPIRSLWLAANWFHFPRAEPGPGMVAVRQHHVMVIRQYLGGGRARVYDANSGHHLTRIHDVSLAGYSIRNPHGGREWTAARRPREAYHHNLIRVGYTVRTTRYPMVAWDRDNDY
jgi:hypothetical protein